jgi:DNA-binding transcriptional regulator YiaG
MTQKAFAEYFGISKRAVESWEGGQRECPAYLMDLMKYKLEHEGKIISKTFAKPIDISHIV